MNSAPSHFLCGIQALRGIKAACENGSGIMDQLAHSTEQRIETHRSKIPPLQLKQGPWVNGRVALATIFKLFIAYMCTNLIMTSLFGCSGANGCSQCEHITVVVGNDP